MKLVERKLGRERALGQAIHAEGLIEVDPRQNSKEYLDTLLHEALHLVSPEWSERRVATTASKLTRLVWKQGYRRLQK